MPMTQKQTDAMWSNVALTAARLWAEGEMEKIDPNALVSALTRAEYQELLTIVYALGFERGVKVHRGR